MSDYNPATDRAKDTRKGLYPTSDTSMIGEEELERQARERQKKTPLPETEHPTPESLSRRAQDYHDFPKVKELGKK